MLAPNEGLVIANLRALVATGVVRLYVKSGHDRETIAFGKRGRYW